MENLRLSYAEAVALQNELKKKLVLSPLPHPPATVGGSDVSVTRKEDVAFASIVVMDVGTLEVLDESMASVEISFPYIPGLLSFREGPAVTAAFNKLRTKPDLLLFDGHGTCHPRGFGLASHMGVALNIPSIGCAKSHFYGNFEMPGQERGSISWVTDRNNDKIGLVVRTRTDVAPVYVSPGHMTAFEDCLSIVLSLTPRYRIPEPLRKAHQHCKASRARMLAGLSGCNKSMQQGDLRA